MGYGSMLNSKEMGKKGGSSTSAVKVSASRENGKKGGRIPIVSVNDDGCSINGCNMIYAPKGQALEYAALATNHTGGVVMSVNTVTSQTS